MDSGNLRRAVRALVVRADESVLLVRFDSPPDFPDVTVWAAPGGGLEPGEDLTSALRRELREELGLVDFDLGPPVWTRTHVFTLDDYAGQTETFFLIRVDQFDPAPALSAQELLAEGVTEIAWWSPMELSRAVDTFAPTRLPILLPQLLQDGPPPNPLDVGV